jgi:hypothetical protein
MKSIGWGLVSLIVLSALLSSCAPGVFGVSCEVPAFEPPAYLPNAMLIDVSGEGNDAVFVINYVDGEGEAQTRTVYTLTWLGDHSPNNPDCDDWIPVVSDKAGNITFAEGFLLQYQSLPEVNKDVKGYKIGQYGTEYRGILNTEKRKFYGDVYTATYNGHLLFYFADEKYKPNTAYWRPVKLGIEKYSDEIIRAASCCR